jgi:hypothetical protein
MVTVEILIPCYNYGKYLVDCVESVLSQKNVNVDILIIDDCSPDNTPEVCRQLMQRDSRIRVIRHETNKGHIATYNEGIAQISGDYFVLLSADDLLTPGALSRATALMEENPKIGMTYGQAIWFDKADLPPARTVQTGTSVWSGQKWIREVCRSGKNFVVCPEAVVRTSIQRKIGGYNPALPHSGDMEMWLRIASISDIGRVNGADQAYYRAHPQSMQHTVHSGFLFDLIGRRDALQSVFEKEGAALPEREELHNLGKMSLALTAIQHARKLCDFPSEDTVPGTEYRDFAVALVPGIIDTRRYRALLAAQMPDKTPLQKAVSLYKARIRKFAEAEIVNRAEYHWSRRTGVYFPRYYL